MIANKDTDKPPLVTSSSQTMLSHGDMLATDKPVLATSHSQTMFCCGDMLACKIDCVISKRRANKLSPRKLSMEKNSNFTCDAISKDATQFQFYTCLGDDVDILTFWRGSRTCKQKTSKKYGQPKLSVNEQLLLTLIKIRRSFSNRDLAYRFHIGAGTVSVIVITWIQLLYTKTSVLTFSPLYRPVPPALDSPFYRPLAPALDSHSQRPQTASTTTPIADSHHPTPFESVNLHIKR